MAPVLLSLILPSLATRALAFAPTEGAGAAPNRIEHKHLQEQLRLRHLPAWEEFTLGEGRGRDGSGAWTATWDETERTPVRAMGPGIALDDTTTAAGVEASLRTFFAANPGLAGVPDAELVVRSIGYSGATGMWYVDFDRLITGVPIWRGGVTARVRALEGQGDGELVMFGIKTYPSVLGLAKATVSTQDAEAIAQLEGPAAMADHTGVTASLVALPWDRDGGVDVRLCWEVHSHTASPVGDWVTHVDALTGERLNTYNSISFFEGVVQGTHDTRTVDGNYTTSSLPEGKFTGADGTTEYADSTGAMSLSDATTWTMGLNGSYVTVRNMAGSNGAMAVTADSQIWTTVYATQAEIDTYKFVFDVRDWGDDIAPGLGMMSEPLTAKVNSNSNCNAYYDGNLNFYKEGGGCNNTGRIADVIYHEWGHGFHYYSLEAGTYDGSMSEGISDTVATFLTHDSQIGPYFYTSGGPVRDVSVTRIYPDDMDGEVHDEGLIFGGAVWDLWEALDTTYGESREESGTAWRTVNTLLANGIKAGPTIPDSYDEFLLADDDDNNTSNGTPHMCELIEAFGAHGLGPGADGAVIGLDHTALVNQPAGVPVFVPGLVVNLAPGCTEFTLASANVHYSTDSGSTWSDAVATLAGDDFTAELPAFPADSIVEYYLSAVASDGTEVTLPAGGVIAPYTFYVGGLREIWCASLDEDDGGFTHELLDGREAEGADDWTWDRPQGMAGDPSDPYTGRQVWGNDLGGGNYNGEYQAEVQNRLSSPAIDVGGDTQLILQYRRWLNVEDGLYDQASIYANDAVVWGNHTTAERRGDEHTQDEEWMLHTVRLSDVSSPLTLGWDLTSDGGLEFGGWNIDDVCVYVADTGSGGTDSDSGGDDGAGGDDPGDTSGGGGIEIGGGCSCATAPAVPWPAAGLFVAMLAVRRRRVS